MIPDQCPDCGRHRRHEWGHGTRCANDWHRQVLEAPPRPHPLEVVKARMTTLRMAIVTRDWEAVEFQYDRVASAISKAETGVPRDPRTGERFPDPPATCYACQQSRPDPGG